MASSSGTKLSRQEVLGELRLDSSLPPPPEDEASLSGLLERSRKFLSLNPTYTEHNLTSDLLERGDRSPDVLLNNANGAYPLLHEKLIPLFADFLRLKRARGTTIEKEIYRDMGLCALVDRLLEKRPLMFVGEVDKYVLRDHPEEDSQRGGIGGERFLDIGTEKEREPLVMRDYLSYDEMKLSALLGTCSATAAVNKGDRHNKCLPGKDGEFLEQAYIVGLVGTRLAKPGTVEYQDVRVNKKQNVAADGCRAFFGKKRKGGEDGDNMGGVFARFYGIDHFPVFKEVEELHHPSFLDKVKKLGAAASTLDREHFVPIQDFPTGRKRGEKTVTEVEYFNRHVYEQRVRLSAETLLAEANARAGAEGKKAYVHVVGLGLGVWKLIAAQEQWFVDVFASCLCRMSLPHVSDVDFSWIAVPLVGGVEDGGLCPGTDIKIHISRRDPYEPLPEGGDGKVVVSCWAYDGNSYPGNEYWRGSLSTSSDPAAACATQVVELHNPRINPKMSGANLRICTAKGEVMPLAEFAERWSCLT